MRIDRIEFSGIKSFEGKITLDLDGDVSLFALSGRNGAGKSTVLKLPWLVQKAHLVSLLNRTDLTADFSEEVGRFFTKSSSMVKVTFSFGDDTGSILMRPGPGPSGFSLDYQRKDLFDQRWNKDAPTDLILYIDASKGFSEATLKFDEISIIGNERNSLALEAALNPEVLFTRIYRQLVKDHIHERLIPSSPSRMLYYKVASSMFTKLMPKVELKNFSGQHKRGEFVLLGRTSSGKYRPLYDVREFSSGEKALLSTLTFLCISKSVSTLIIDEPENHFHESLLLEFMGLLKTLCEKGGINKWAAAQKHAKLKTDEIAKEYKDHNLNQVLVSTHSKSLIYRFFLLGKNFVLDQSLQPISQESAEAKLREIGLSTIHSRVLFVEGAGDHASLEGILGDQNVSIRSLGGSKAVVDTFVRLAQIRGQVRDARFVFLIDSDNKPADYFSEVRAKSQEFYDQSFILLDRHEFENYLLSPKAFKEAVDSIFALANKDEPPTEATIRTRLVALARESMPQVHKKELSLAFQQAIERHFARLIWGSKSFSWSSPASIQTELTNRVLTVPEAQALNDGLIETAKEVFSGYATASEEALLKRCDGKQVLGKACSEFAKLSGVESRYFRSVVEAKALTNPSSDVSKLVANIRARLTS